MDSSKIAKLMEASVFRNVRAPSEYEGVLFDVVGEARVGLRKMTTVVRTVGGLDHEASRRIGEEFLRLHAKKISEPSGHPFLYCLLTERREKEASEWLLDAVYRGTHNPDHTEGASGGRFLVADAETGWAFMNETKRGVGKVEMALIGVLREAGVVHPPRKNP